VAPGWKLRVLLVQALFANPDILLLDEPTNNLDINTIRWLEDVLNKRESTMVIISHDRHFLNQVCTHMADLDYGKVTVYPGNYDDFMEATREAVSAFTQYRVEAHGEIPKKLINGTVAHDLLNARFSYLGALTIRKCAQQVIPQGLVEDANALVNNSDVFSKPLEACLRQARSIALYASSVRIKCTGK
jgi:ABC-type multidrug transport system ATPase subunit